MNTPFVNQQSCKNLYICTFIVDPNHFYICDKAAYKSGIVKNVETRLEAYLKENKNVYRGSDAPIAEDVSDKNAIKISLTYFFNIQCVAYYHKGKFIRCEVLDVKELNNTTCYVLFATDHRQL